MSGLQPLHPVPRFLLRAYKLTLSPLFYVFGARCRHHPSCSEFGAEAVTRHGLWAGGWMTLGRLSRCRPGGTSGEDPVPEARPAVPAWQPWRYANWRGGEAGPVETGPQS